MVLGEGQYALLCLIEDEKEVGHFQNGMFDGFEVRGGDAAAALPEAEATITTQEYSFDVPALEAGKSLIEFKNAGAQLHHVQMFPLSPGKTIEDVKTFFMTEGAPSGPPPLDFERGTGTAVTDGGTGFVTEIDLAKGDYALVCFLTDRTGGPPHFTKGMLQAVTIE